MRKGYGREKRCDKTKKGIRDRKKGMRKGNKDREGKKGKSKRKKY